MYMNSVTGSKISGAAHRAARTALSFIAALAFATVNIGFAGAAEAVNAGAAVQKKHRVLCLYKSSEGSTAISNECLNMLGVPLHYLGQRVEYRDIDSGIPSDDYLKYFDAVISWYGTGEMKNAGDYCRFVKRAVGSGLKFVIFENFGAYTDTAANKPVEMNLLNDAFGAVGFRYVGNWTADTSCVAVEKIDRKMCEFETQYTGPVSLFYTQFCVLDTAESRVYLKIKRNDLPGSSSDAVFSTPKGGMVLNSYAYYSSADFTRKKWRIDPFSFLEDALGLKGEMRLDTTTKNGKRMLFSHVDGDGFANISEIDRKSLCAEVIRDRIFAAPKYSKVKFSVSFIAGQIDPKYSNDTKFCGIAKSIYALGNVEGASHGLSHPYDWEKKELILKVPGYEFSYRGEIVDSLAFINSLLPAGKKTSLLFWSGRCNPPAAAMEVVKQNGILNINGGDSKFDSKYDSLLFLRPPCVNIGKVYQILTAAPNEVIYTEIFTKNFDGYKKVVETFKNTEKPRRLAPIDVYFHFFSGQKNETLSALECALDYALSCDPEPVGASEYVRAVEDFLGARVTKTGEGVYVIANSGALPSVRFDEPGLELDAANSKNVGGSAVVNGSLYVSLDGEKTHTVCVRKADVK